MIEYVIGSDLPDVALTWKDNNGGIIDFSTGWTFSAKVGKPGTSTTAFTKSSGFTGASTAPNLMIQWATSGELNSLTAGTYTCQVTATRISDSRSRIMEFRIRAKQALT